MGIACSPVPQPKLNNLGRLVWIAEICLQKVGSNKAPDILNIFSDILKYITTIITHGISKTEANIVLAYRKFNYPAKSYAQVYLIKHKNLVDIKKCNL